MLYYCPLECYKERYTMQWSAPKTGWLERNWIKHKIPYLRVDSPAGTTSQAITTGSVLDSERRTEHAFSQVLQLIQMAVRGQIVDDDIIYFDDFWHPGIEMLPYTFHLLNIHPKMFAFCHAQSVDKYDFTYPMRHWMRPFEIGIGQILDGIFVNSSILRTLLLRAMISSPEKIHVIGHIFSEEEVLSRYYEKEVRKEDRVVFSSRWDWEKDPEFFLQVAQRVINKQPNIKFIICTSSPKLKSNDKILLQNLEETIKLYPDNIILKEGLTKEDYYHELRRAKIQMNTSLQDFVSIVLLEASVAGCYPVYPNFRSFPQAFRDDKNFMYKPQDVEDATDMILSVLDNDSNWSKESIESRAWIHRRHNSSWARMINIMMDTSVMEVEPYV